MKRSLLAVTIALLVAASAASAGSVPAKPPVVKSQIWLVLQGQKLGPDHERHDRRRGRRPRYPDQGCKRHCQDGTAHDQAPEAERGRDLAGRGRPDPRRGRRLDASGARGRRGQQTVQLELDSPAGARIAAWTLTNAIPTKVQFGTTPNGHPKVALTFATSSISVVK